MGTGEAVGGDAGRLLAALLAGEGQLARHVLETLDDGSIQQMMALVSVVGHEAALLRPLVAAEVKTELAGEANPIMLLRRNTLFIRVASLHTKVS
jgi:hypothetical protein